MSLWNRSAARNAITVYACAVAIACGSADVAGTDRTGGTTPFLHFDLSVTPPYGTAVSSRFGVTPIPTATTYIGDTVRFSSAAFRAIGAGSVDSIMVTSSDPSFLAVSQTQILQGAYGTAIVRRAGTATLTARVSGVSTSVTVTATAYRSGILALSFEPESFIAGDSVKIGVTRSTSDGGREAIDVSQYRFSVFGPSGAVIRNGYFVTAYTGSYSILAYPPAGSNWLSDPFIVGGPPSAYPIDVRFVGDVSTFMQKDVRNAARLWGAVVLGPGGPQTVTRADQAKCLFAPPMNEVVPGLVIFVRYEDGPTNVQLDNPQPCVSRSNGLPAVGELTIARGDLGQYTSPMRLALHRMGHLLGIGAPFLGSPYYSGGANPTFAGPGAMAAAYAIKMVPTASTPVPLSSTTEPTFPFGEIAYLHWRYPAAGYGDIMTFFDQTRAPSIRRLDAAALADLGYDVFLRGAEP